MNLPESRRNRLAELVQEAFPLVDEPYLALAAALGATPDEILDQLVAWRDEGLLREISAVLEGSALGYESALVAARVPERDLERVANLVSGHPTVTHNYLRDHAYNLWFTIAVPCSMGLDRTLAILSAETGGLAMHPLRRTATFKIGVRFRLDSLENDTVPAESAPPSLRLHPDDETRAILRALQTPLPLVERPFDQLARSTGVRTGALLECAGALRDRVVRRYAATFRHRKLGVRGNGMAVWRVPAERIDEVGRALATIPQVSHCYARTTLDDFPYPLYSMIHAADEAGVQEIARAAGARFGVEEHAVLFSRREFKKCRLRYYLPDLDAWWSERCPSVA